MAFYEHIFIIRQDIPVAQVKSLADHFKGITEEKGGHVSKIEYCGLRSLAYRIRKNRKGHYVLMNMDAPAVAVHELERQMRLHEDVLRFLTVRVEALDPNPSCLVQNRSGRGERLEEEQTLPSPQHENDHSESKLSSQEAIV